MCSFQARYQDSVSQGYSEMLKEIALKYELQSLLLYVNFLIEQANVIVELEVMMLRKQYLMS